MTLKSKFVPEESDGFVNLDELRTLLETTTEQTQVYTNIKLCI